MRKLFIVIILYLTIGSASQLKSQEIILSTDSIPVSSFYQDSLTQINVRISSDVGTYSTLKQGIGTVDVSESRALDVGRQLQAQVSGLSISNNSYSPGASTRMILRGYRSLLGSSEPQIFLDGMPLDNSEWHNGLRGTDQSNRLMDIDPNSIESISVVKNSADRAQYGIVGGNGVIHIKTKKGKPSKPRFSFSSSIGLDMVTQLPALQSTYAPGRTIDGISSYRGPELVEASSWGPLIDDLVYEVDVDYPFDNNGRLVVGQNGNPANRYDPYTLFQNGLFTNNSLSVDGRSHDIQYRAQVSNNIQNGVIPTTSYERYNFSGALSLSVTEKLSLLVNTQLSTSSAIRNLKGANLNGVMLGLLRTPSTFDNTNGSSDPVSDPAAYTYQDGEQHRSYRDGIYANPYWTLNKNNHEDKVNRQVFSLSSEYKLSKNLSLAMTVGRDHYFDNRIGGTDINPAQGSVLSSGSAYERTLDFTAQYVDLSAHYNFELGDAWELSSLFRTNYHRSDAQYDIIEGISLRASGNVSVDNIEEVEAYQYGYELERFGGMASIEAKYLNLLELSGSLRQDYSNKMGASTNGFLSYGFGVGLSLTELMNKENANHIADIKLIGSYGLFGNYKGGSRLENSRYVSSIISGDGFISTSTLENPEVNEILRSDRLNVEETNSYDIGFAVRLNKLGLDILATYYKENSSGLIVADPLASSSGFEFVESNVGAITNSGVDLSLLMTPIEKEKIKWDLRVDFNKNRNEVTAIGRNEELILGGFNSASSVVTIDQSYGAIYGTAFLRNDEGQMIIDESGFPLLDSERQVVSNPNPDWTMYLSNTLKIGKALSIGVLVDIKKGGEMYCGTCATLDYLGRSQLSADERGTSMVFEGVTEAGQPNTKAVELAPQSGNSSEYYRVRYGFTGVTELNVFDAGWVRLRSLSCTYDLGNLVNAGFLSRFSVGLFAENLFVISSYPSIDPETNLTGNAGGIGLDYYNNPGTKRFGFRVQASF